VNRNIDTSSNCERSGIPESLGGKIQVKLLQNYCPELLNLMKLIHQDNNFVTVHLI